MNCHQPSFVPVYARSPYYENLFFPRYSLPGHCPSFGRAKKSYPEKADNSLIIGAAGGDTDNKNQIIKLL